MPPKRRRSPDAAAAGGGGRSEALSIARDDGRPPLAAALTLPCGSSSGGDGDGQRPLVAAVLLHGAGGGHESGNLPAFARALADAGVPVLSYTYRSPGLEARTEALRQALRHSPVQPRRAWLLAGHSMGCRVAAAVAAERSDVAGLLLCSYPLHPPGRPQELRDAALRGLAPPLLLVRGDRDAFSTPGPFAAALARLTTSDATVHTVAGGDHGLVISGRGGGAAASTAALEAACAAITAFARRITAPAAPAAAAVAGTKRRRRGGGGAGGRDGAVNGVT